MSVKLFSYTQTVEAPTTVEEQIAYVARVSNPANQGNKETAAKLIKYLIDNKHWSPFEMAYACVEIETTRDIAHQILRHRSFTFQEFSQRYAVANMGWSYKEARLQDTKNRQNSIELDTDSDLLNWWSEKQKAVTALVEETYKEALDKGIAKEQARGVLPEGLTLTRMYMMGNIRSWIHYVELRTKPGTQKEHRQVALDAAEAIKPIFPLIELYVSHNTYDGAPT